MFFPSFGKAAAILRPRRFLTVTALFVPRLYPCALVFAVAFCCAHMISLPVGVSYDGYLYIELADVLGSDRFPRDWFVARTPLFPLTLKAAFWLFGRQPLAAILVATLLGLGGVLVLGAVVRRVAGRLAGAISVVLLTLFPTYVAFQHFVLTETGTAFFLAAALLLVLWFPGRPASTWVKAVGLICVVAAGYYWRQALLATAPVIAILHGLGCYRAALGFPGPAHGNLRARAVRAGAISLLLQMLFVAILPSRLARPWSRHVNDAAMMDVTIRQGLLRQALLPPDHPYVGEHQQAYRQALRDSLYRGTLHSGLRSDLLGLMSEKIYSKPMGRPPKEFFFELIGDHPQRYAAGFGRTLVLFAGVKALENENHIARTIILSPDLPGAKLSEGPASIQDKIKADFQQVSKPCLILKVLWNLVPFYDPLLIYANTLTAAGLLFGLIFRNARILMMCVVPLAYMISCALVLASIDRYAFPAYPLVLANGVALPVMMCNTLAERCKRRPVLGAME